MTNEQLCNRIIHLIHTPIHVYSADGTCIAVHIDMGEQQNVLTCDPDFAKELLDKRNQEHPVLYLEMQKVVYGVICNGEETYILGPCAIRRDTNAVSRYLLRQHHMSYSIPYKVSYVPLMTFNEMVLMLHEQFTGITLNGNELFLHCFSDEVLKKAMDTQAAQVMLDFQLKETVHNPYSQEIREQEAIRTGDLEALEQSFHEPFIGDVGTLASDPVRNAKNIAIVLITLACRSVIAGGLFSEIAFSMSDGFIQQAEQMNEIGAIFALGREAEIKYCLAVKEASEMHGHNPLVKRCQELVIQNLHAKITSQDLAVQLGVASSYLSRLFVKETGIKLKDYIANEKVKAAKKQMIYTEDSFNTIACALGFSTQSHFGKVFHKVTGMTPGEYREKYR